MAEVIPIKCAHCDQAVSADVVADDRRAGIQRFWLRCPSCEWGSVMNTDGVVSPTAVPAEGFIRNLPDDVQRAWQEARAAYAVTAFTASEMMCRKILMHLAVDVADSEPGKSFVQYVDALDDAGYIMKGIKPTVDQIRSRGNKATHSLDASTPEEATATLRITGYILQGVYELPQAESTTP